MRTYIEKPCNVEYNMVWYSNPDTILQHFPPFAETKDGELLDKPFEHSRKALVIRFDLSTGNYATMALRELLHLDIGKETQKQLSLQLRSEKGDVKKGEE
jgi:tRNA(Glu) U13 pseudouridine synthase TruD